MRAVRCPARPEQNIRRIALVIAIAAVIALATATTVSAAPASATIGGIERIHRSARVVLTGLIDWVDGVSPRLESRGPLSLSVVSTDREDAPRRMLLLTSTPTAPAETVKLRATEETRSWRWVNGASGSR